MEIAFSVDYPPPVYIPDVQIQQAEPGKVTTTIRTVEYDECHQALGEIDCMIDCRCFFCMRRNGECLEEGTTSWSHWAHTPLIFLANDDNDEIVNRFEDNKVIKADIIGNENTIYAIICEDAPILKEMFDYDRVMERYEQFLEENDHPSESTELRSA